MASLIAPLLSLIAPQTHASAPDTTLRKDSAGDIATLNADFRRALDGQSDPANVPALLSASLAAGTPIGSAASGSRSAGGNLRLAADAQKGNQMDSTLNKHMDSKKATKAQTGKPKPKTVSPKLSAGTKAGST
jgi:hypothetical protein